MQQCKPDPVSPFRDPVLTPFVGVSEAERIRVSHAEQGFKPGVPVMQLRVESLNAPKRAAGGKGGR